jgi:hypothetical protein
MDADARQIEPIGVPARLNGHVRMCQLMGMVRACLPKDLKIQIRQMDDSAAQFGRELRSPKAVIGIGALIDSSGIVEDGKKPNDR